jgi:hypothetical protein
MGETIDGARKEEKNDGVLSGESSAPTRSRTRNPHHELV